MTAALEVGEWSAARPGRTLRPGKDTVPIAQEAGWARGPVWKGGKSRPHRNSIPDPLSRSHSLYRMSYRAQEEKLYRVSKNHYKPQDFYIDFCIKTSHFCLMSLLGSIQ